MTNGNDSAAVKNGGRVFLRFAGPTTSIEITLELDIFHQIRRIETIFLHFSYIVGVDTVHFQELERMERNIVVADLVKAIDKLRGDPCTLEHDHLVNVE